MESREYGGSSRGRQEPKNNECAQRPSAKQHEVSYAFLLVRANLGDGSSCTLRASCRTGQSLLAYNLNDMAIMTRARILGARKSNDSKARVLALDYGRRRVGLAVSDEMGITARPLGTLERKNRRTDMARLGRIVRENGVGRIVVGYPLNMDGTVSEMAEEAARFGARLERELKLPVELLDERLTSWEAEQTLRKKQGGKKSAPDAVDELAAAILLREYLEPRASRAVTAAKE